MRLRDGALWVHSPIDLDDATRAAIRRARVGETRRVAKLRAREVGGAVEGGVPRRDALRVPGDESEEAGDSVGTRRWAEDGAPEAWGGEFDVALFDCEVNPFTSTPFFNEVVFCHAASGVAFVTDVFWNYPGGDDVPPGTRLWKFGMDRVYLPFYRAAMVRDREKFARAREKVLSWDFDARAAVSRVVHPARRERRAAEAPRAVNASSG